MITLEHREINPEDPQLLFLSYIKPLKPVTSQRLANWIKDILGKAGIDPSLFKVHTVKGAFSTAASTKGILIENILRTADWSTESTFQQFYTLLPCLEECTTTVYGVVTSEKKLDNLGPTITVSATVNQRHWISSDYPFIDVCHFSLIPGTETTSIERGMENCYEKEIESS